MAQEQDDAQKTEEPTDRKLQEARRKGQVASSQEVKSWFILLGALAMIGLLAPGAVGMLTRGFTGIVDRAHQYPMDSASLLEMLSQGVGYVGLALAGPFAILLVMAILGSVSQTGLLMSAENMKPNLNKINPISGLKRQFSLRAIMEFLKGLLKLTIVGGIAGLVVWPTLSALDAFAGMDPASLLHRMWEAALLVLFAVVAVMAVIAALDYSFQRYDYMQKQKMTRQEVKDEHKQAEGDPMVKARLRQIRQERTRRRMMSNVPSADVVVTNPTHFAVALKYDPDAMPAPVLVAKGIDHVAARIREVAEAHDIAVVENPPLARALYAGVEIDQEIPYEHYKAVAEVISYVFRLRGRSPGAATTAAAAGMAAGAGSIGAAGPRPEPARGAGSAAGRA